MQTLQYTEVEFRQKLLSLAGAQKPQVLDPGLLPPALDVVKNVLFHVENSPRGPPKAVMIPSYARRVRAALLPSGRMDPRSFPAYSAVADCVFVQMLMFGALHRSVPRAALHNSDHPIGPFLERALVDTFGAVTAGDPRALKWFAKTLDVIKDGNLLVLYSLIDMARAPPGTLQGSEHLGWIRSLIF